MPRVSGAFLFKAIAEKHSPRVPVFLFIVVIIHPFLRGRFQKPPFLLFSIAAFINTCQIAKIHKIQTDTRTLRCIRTFEIS